MALAAPQAIDLRSGDAERYAALVALTRDLLAVLQGPGAARASDAAMLAHCSLDLSQRDNPPPETPACRKGCGHCCRVYVSATATEVFAVARAIRALPSAHGETIAARVRTASAATTGRDWSLDPFFTYLCPLLEDEACTLHPERPDACRGVSSYSATACQASIAALATGQDVAIPRVEEHFFLRALHAHALWAALRLAGFSDVQYSLNQALDRALATPDAEARWLEGEDVFRGVPTDSSMAGERQVMADVMIAALIAAATDGLDPGALAATAARAPTSGREAVPPIELALRPAQAADSAFRLALFVETRPELALLPLEEAGRDRLIAIQVAAQDAATREQHPDAETSIIELAGRPIGRLVVDRAGDHLHVVDIALVSATRRRGIGTQILRALIEEASQAGVAMRLSVAAGNAAAARLYARLGFVPVSRDPMYIRMERPP